ncbi:MAG: hypothetical protein IJY93_06180 [Clostridia bacterium]|nr:hypothetical protein [Clostridia bacterium]
MDKIKEKIEEVVAKLKGDDKLMEKFKSDPIKTLEGIIGIDLPDDMISKVVDGVKAKLAAGDLADKADDVKDAIGGLFSKFKK